MRNKYFWSLAWMFVAVNSYVFAEEYKPLLHDGNGLFYKVISEEDATAKVSEIAAYTGGHIEIASYVSDEATEKKYRVVSIGESVFENNHDLLSILIPSTVEIIEKNAFRNCKYLESVIFSNSVKNIEEKAFDGCIALKNLALPYDLEEIGKSAFGGCISLTSIIIPDKVRIIGEYAFGGCVNNETLVLGKSVEYLKYGSFTAMSEDKLHDIYNVFDIVYSLNAVAPIPYGAFSGCADKIYIPRGSQENYDYYSDWMMMGPKTDLPAVFVVFYQNEYTVVEGEEVELEYCLFNPDNVEIESMYWEAFNDRAVELEEEIAKGLKGGETTTVTLTVLDSEGQEYRSECRVKVLKNAGIMSPVEDNCSGSAEIYSINGVKTGIPEDNLSPGIYIKKIGGTSEKIIIR